MFAARWALALVALVACGGDGASGGAVPRADDPCTDGEAARCGYGEGANAKRNTVLVCDGGQWSSALECGRDETCRDDDVRGAVECTEINDLHYYGEHAGPCEVEGANACSFERDFVLVCEGGTWAIDTNCSTNVLDCTFVTPKDDATCTEADGCVVCA